MRSSGVRGAAVRPARAARRQRARRATPGTFAHISVRSGRADAPAAVDHARATRARAGSSSYTSRRATGSTSCPRAAAARCSACSRRSAAASRRDRARPQLLALGGGVGIPPMMFLADQFRARAGVQDARADGLRDAVSVRARRVAARSGWRLRRSNACGPLLERWGVPSGSRAMRGCRAVTAAT